MIATPKKAWNDIVANSSTSRSDGAQRLGPGSMPMRAQLNTYPASMKCTIIAMWPTWVRSASSNRPEK